MAATFTALPEHIDENGHVNNTVWVRWMEDIATAHWMRDADPAHVAAYAWVVTRHEIDYRGNIGLDDSVEGVTEIKEGPTGARFDRHFTFTNADGKAVVRAKTSWAMVDRSILFEGVDVGRYCRLRKVIVDKNVKLPPYTVIGFDHEFDRRRGFTVTESGQTRAGCPSVMYVRAGAPSRPGANPGMVSSAASLI